MCPKMAQKRFSAFRFRVQPVSEDPSLVGYEASLRTRYCLLLVFPSVVIEYQVCWEFQAVVYPSGLHLVT